jgi:hypothetical protein
MDTRIDPLIDNIDHLPIPEARRRFFIVTSGRTGSSLLAAILADAGADFAMSVPARWDPSGGEMEHPDAAIAGDFFRAAEDISVGRPHGWIDRCRWRLLKSAGKRRLRAALHEARFVKAVDGHVLIRPAFKLGFFPSVILSYRRFDEYAISSSLMVPETSIDAIAARYRSANRNGLLLLRIFGGCAVSYEQLVDCRDRSWVEPLAQVTQLSADKLLAMRDCRVEEPARSLAHVELDRPAQRVFEAVEAFRGSVVAPSPQVLRLARGLASSTGPAELDLPPAPSGLRYWRGLRTRFP